MTTSTMEATAEQRKTLLKAATDIAEKAKAESRDLTPEESGTIDQHLADAKSIGERLEATARTKSTLAALDAMVKPEQERGTDEGPAKSLGQHFIKHGHGRLIEAKGVKGVSVAVPEFAAKAATDTHTITGWAGGVPLLTDYDRNVVRAYRPRLTIADLLGSGTLSGNAISYLVEGAREGDFATVAETGAKPQMHYVNPTPVVDGLKKIAGFIKLSDEFIEDAEFLVSEIDVRLIYDLGWREEQQLLNGNGVGQNLVGLLNRAGIQTETATGPDDNADAIFRARTKVDTATGLPVDGLVIHPLDYQQFRLAKDGNKQYYGGGFFQGQYGNGAVLSEPPLWGIPTVVTPAITAGTVLVGAYGMASTLYRKGGVRVESTNSHSDDFTDNLVTIRAEERVALAVRVPLGFTKVTLDWTA
ncbi:phage major capsid protein [Mycobacteroides abscessus subsp. abscessus]|uniref:phage major capsid protein n=1 Tax=Mycobacteroides abscessus TaxID=36809 RepID=UPI0039EF2E52